MAPEEKRELAATLSATGASAVLVPRLGDRLGPWAPKLGGCHKNFARWIGLHADHTAVRGWLDISFLAIPPARWLMATDKTPDRFKGTPKC